MVSGYANPCEPTAINTDFGVDRNISTSANSASPQTCDGECPGGQPGIGGMLLDLFRSVLDRGCRAVFDESLSLVRDLNCMEDERRKLYAGLPLPRSEVIACT